jgi:hypothetical protein
MASIRIVDDWLRFPAAAPSHWRSVMVIAEKWGEQRVMMRAYADSRDQTRPTIMLHSVELAIGPAGLDANGPWGIHVGADNDADRAQLIKQQLEQAARRIAGSKGNPPRLLDEEPTFDREPTGSWGHGAPRLVPRGEGSYAAAQQHAPVVIAPAQAARVQSVQQATYVPHGHAAVQKLSAHAQPHAPVATSPSNPELRRTPLPRNRDQTRPPPTGGFARTVNGYASGSGAQSAVIRLGLAPQVSARLGRLVDRVVPGDFHIDARERGVLNALGQVDLLTARSIGQMIGVHDAVAWMEALTRKLETYGLDLIEPADPYGGEPTYRLRG